MLCFITYTVMARDLRISRQQLTQQILDEYLMFFQLITSDSYPVAIEVFFGLREDWGLGGGARGVSWEGMKEK